MPTKLNLIGRKFGRLTILKADLESERRGTRWFCQCECGTVKSIPTCSLTAGHSKSCGCIVIERCIAMGKSKATHGIRITPTGVSWHGMISRCYNKNISSYKYYGARGIKACEFLRSTPHNLILLIGVRPTGKTLDRTDTNGMYSCGTCQECFHAGWKFNIRWATVSQQNRNTRRAMMATINGVTMHRMEWCDKFNLKPTLFAHRMRKGWTGEMLLRPSANKNGRRKNITV